MDTLDNETKKILQESEHLLMEYQDQITSRMYEIMFDRHPDIKVMFKHARNHQPKVFAAALMSHIVSMDDLDVLQSFRISICRRHVVAGVKEEHYAIMSDALFEAMEEVLKDHATVTIINAWKIWFNYLAKLFIERERDHYEGKHLLFPDDSDQGKHYYQDKFDIFSAND